MIRFKKVAFALFVAAMMLAVPVSLTDDSEALVDGSTGIYFTADNGLTLEEYVALTGDTTYEMLSIVPAIFGDNMLDYADVDEFHADRIDEFTRGIGVWTTGNNDYGVTEIVRYTVTFDMVLYVHYSTDQVYLTPDLDTPELDNYLAITHFEAGDYIRVSGTMTLMSLVAEYFQYEMYTTNPEDGAIVEMIEQVGISAANYEVDISYIPQGDVTESKEFSIENRLEYSDAMGIFLDLLGKSPSEITDDDRCMITFVELIDVFHGECLIGIEGEEYLKEYEFAPTMIGLEATFGELKASIFGALLILESPPVLEPSTSATLFDIFPGAQVPFDELNAMCYELGDMGYSLQAVLDEGDRISQEVITFTVSYDSNGGSRVKDATVGMYTAMNAPMEPVREGYTFAGWYTDPSLTSDSKWDFENDTVEEDMVLYAKWIPNQYDVALDANGGTVSSGHIDVTYGDSYGLLPTPTREGFVFDGWYTAADDSGVQVYGRTQVTLTESQTLYAHWTPIERGTAKMDLNVGVLLVITIAIAAGAVMVVRRFS